jgi:hypothetical protein
MIQLIVQKSNQNSMTYKNTITVTAISIIAVFAVTSFVNFDEFYADAQKTATQPSKFVFVENISTTMNFKFRDGEELMPVQQFTQTGGFGTKELKGADDPRAPTGVTGRSKPAFTMEKIVGETPLLYKAADERQLRALASTLEYSWKSFDVDVVIGNGDYILREFSYRDCQVVNYNVATRSDNEEGYTGKGYAIVDQFTFECDGYTPLNPLYDLMNKVPKANTASSSILKGTTTWGPGFK